jgi:hypothetical protein
MIEEKKQKIKSVSNFLVAEHLILEVIIILFLCGRDINMSKCRSRSGNLWTRSQVHREAKLVYITLK